jgi:peptide/nickel transport system permease protein
MTRYLALRLAQAGITMFLVSVITFTMINLAPGGPGIMMKMEFTAQQRAAISRNLGLGQPVQVRYVKWLAAIGRGEFGLSFNDGRDVLTIILERLPNTLLLSGSAFALSLLVGFPLGIVSAIRRYSLLDYVATFVSLLGVSIPGFWLGILLILIFAVELSWLPPSGIASSSGAFSFADRLRHLIMPTVVLSTILLPQVVRFTRSSMLEVLQEDYIRTARAKGLSERAVFLRHAFRNGLFPVITVIGLLLPRLFGGSVITEQIFAWPGMGRLAFTAATGRDYPLIMGLTVFVSLVVVVSNLTVDLLYVWLDPRVRYD